MSLSGVLALVVTGIVGVTQLNGTEAVAADSTALSGEIFTVSPAAGGQAINDPSASDGKALVLLTNATATAPVILPEGGATVTVRAKAAQCVGGPTMTVLVDGKQFIKTTVTTTLWTNYTSPSIGFAAGVHTLSVVMSNELALGSGCDRSLWIDGVTLTANTPSTTTTPTTSTTATTSTTPTTTTTTPPAGSNATAAVPFAASSPFRTAIPTAAAIDPKSAAMVARASRNGQAYANLIQFAVPIYPASSSTPKYTLTCTITSWGSCPFNGLQVPIPNGAVPSPGSDGAMVVISPDSNRIYEFWQAKKSLSQWTTSWGAVNALDGSGWGGAATGSGASRLGGVIRVDEIRQGVIPHALALQIDNACSGTYRAPALKTDGNSTRSDCIPEGARLRLDPSLNLASLTLTPAERAVAQALQTYGGYVMDIGGSPLSLSFERDTSAGATSIGTVYQQAGLRWDYDGMPGIPWSRLQVLAS